MALEDVEVLRHILVEQLWAGLLELVVFSLGAAGRDALSAATLDPVHDLHPFCAPHLEHGHKAFVPRQEILPGASKFWRGLHVLALQGLQLVAVRRVDN